jgi:hypothetical protein
LLGSLAYAAATNGWTYAFLLVAAAGAVITAAVLQTVKWWMRRERLAASSAPKAGNAPPKPPEGALGDVTAWEAAGRLLGPGWSLARALLPLLLPILVVVLFVTREYSWLLQGLCGAALISLVWLFLSGESEFQHERDNLGYVYPRGVWKGMRAGLKAGNRLRAVFYWVLPLLGVLIVSFVVARWVAGLAYLGKLKLWDQLAGASGDAEYLAFLIFYVAFFYRLVGWATNPFRWAAAVLFAVLTGQLLVAAGVLRRFDWLTFGQLGWWTIGLFGGVLVLLVAEAVYYSSAPVPGDLWQAARGIGFAVAGACAVALFVSLSIAAAETTGGADRIGDLRATTNVRFGHEHLSNLELAWTFAPVLHLEHAELYNPSRVEAFLSNAENGPDSGAVLRKSKHGQRGLNSQTLPTTCADGGHDACGELVCDRCERITSPKTLRTSGDWVREGVLYARVVRKQADPHAFSGWMPQRYADVRTLIQYWIFYLYDKWQTETLVGTFTQEHQADWEFVAVGLDGGNQPKFVALSAHCGGQVVDWNDSLPAATGYHTKGIQTVDITDHEPAELRDAVTHPIVAVARGSHGNYTSDSGHRPPDFGSCSNLPSGAISAFTYASNVRDVTEQSGDNGWFTYPKDVAVVPSDSKHLGFPFFFPGSWGSGEYLQFGNRDKSRNGDGPRSPPLQGPSWDTPINLFFCSAHWHGGPGDHGSAGQCNPKA